MLQVTTGMVVNDDKYTISYSNLDDREIRWNYYLFYFKSLQLEGGLKHLGFFLKSNAYCIADWMWLLENFEKIFLASRYHWMSRAGRLV